MKRSELFFGALLLPIDFIALMAAGAAGYYLRVSPYVQRVRPAVFELDLPLLEYLQLVGIVALAIVIIFALQGLYAMEATRRLRDELARIFAGISMGLMGIIVYIFLTAELFQSRFILLAAYLFALVFVSLGRWLARRAQIVAMRRGLGAHRVALVGSGRFAGQLEEVFKRRELGIKVVSKLSLVRWDELERAYQAHGLDEIIQTDPTLPEEDNLLLLDFCDKYKLVYKYVPDLFETYAARVKLGDIGGVPLMELLRTPLDGWGRIAKRVLDWLGAVMGLGVLAPLFLITAILIELDTPGPIFYRQTRVGKNRRQFEMFKFRTMRREYCMGDKYGGSHAADFERRLREKLNERLDGPLFKMRNDPRVTRAGRVLRKTRIDELPQLINVLRGEMSLVGPRPHLPQEVERYRKHHSKLFTIKPGMSGMAQVHGNAGLPFEQEAKLDIGYIENWSLGLDVVLLLKTLRILFIDRNAV